MTIECKDFFTFARQLGQQDSEVAFRSAISRAYYAAFHRCKEWEETLPMLGRNEGPEGGSHQELINRLKHPAERCGEILKERSRRNGAQLEAQRHRRVQADYALDETVTAAEMHDQFGQVRQVLERCDAALPRSTP
ncbi:hypothetical protein [Roseateles sp.]|uniref:hypothetical protein n=1 Tax=Roseateles sp. TaxID=1971397 RepID=UPI002F3F4991